MFGKPVRSTRTGKEVRGEAGLGGMPGWQPGGRAPDNPARCRTGPGRCTAGWHSAAWSDGVGTDPACSRSGKGGAPTSSPAAILLYG